MARPVLKTGLTPSASGSAYLELEPPCPKQQSSSTILRSSSLKLACAVHGPRPLPRSAPFSPQLLVNAHVRLTPFASRQRRGYIRDAGERDLTAHLESALKAVVIGDRWPKSGVDVTVTVLEAGEDDSKTASSLGAEQAGSGVFGGWETMTILAGCITVASAAVVDAGIDCVDLVSGGVAGLVVDVNASDARTSEDTGQKSVVLDPCPSEHYRIIAGCVVGYIASRDELVELWMRGDAVEHTQSLIDQAVNAANGSRSVLSEVMKETVKSRVANDTLDPIIAENEMVGNNITKDVGTSV